MSPWPESCTQVFKGHDGPVYCGAFESSGNYLLTGGHDKNIHLYNVHSGTLVSTFGGHGWEVFDLAIASGGQTFLSGGGDRNLFLWDVSTQRVIRRLSGHFQRINSVTFGPQDSIAASASYDRSVRIWDLRSAGRFPLMVLDEAQDSVTTVQIKDYLILTGSVDGFVRSYDVRKGKLFIDNIQSPVTSVVPTGDCLAFLVTSLDSTIRLLDFDSGMLLNQFKGHLNDKYRIPSTLLADDALTAGGSEDGTLFVWDLLDSSVKVQLAGHQQSLTCVTPHPKIKSSLLTCSLDGSARLWS